MFGGQISQTNVQTRGSIHKCCVCLRCVIIYRTMAVIFFLYIAFGFYIFRCFVFVVKSLIALYSSCVNCSEAEQSRVSAYLQVIINAMGHLKNLSEKKEIIVSSDKLSRLMLFNKLPFYTYLIQF